MQSFQNVIDRRKIGTNFTFQRIRNERSKICLHSIHFFEWQLPLFKNWPSANFVFGPWPTRFFRSFGPSRMKCSSYLGPHDVGLSTTQQTTQTSIELNLTTQDSGYGLDYILYRDDVGVKTFSYPGYSGLDEPWSDTGETLGKIINGLIREDCKVKVLRLFLVLGKPMVRVFAQIWDFRLSFLIKIFLLKLQNTIRFDLIRAMNCFIWCSNYLTPCSIYWNL